MSDLIHFKRRNLVVQIEKSFEKESVSNLNFRKQILVLLKDYYKNYYDDIHKQFYRTKDGIKTGQLIAKLSDIIILTSFDAIIKHAFPQPNPTTSDKLSILAIGGYGRNHLSPGSDIDLLILTPYKLVPRTEQIVETLL